MTSIRERGRPGRRSQASKAPMGPTSNRSENENHKYPLKSNKPGPSKAPITSSKAPTRPFKAPTRPPQAPLPQDPGANHYSQQDLDRVIQTFFYTSKGRSKDKLKAKTSDVNRGRSYIECYNFCQ